MRRRPLLIAPLALGLAVAACGGASPKAAPAPADLVLRGGRIVAIGDAADVAPLVGPATRVVELDGRFATPGLIEAHAHFAGLGFASRILRLAPYRSWDGIVAAVAEAAATAPPGSWILGRGWHQEKWDAPLTADVEGFPLNDELDRVAPRNPVVLEHASGHGSLANRLALAAAGIDRDTADPEGGQILHRPDGEPSGMLRETADHLVSEAFKAWREGLAPDAVEAELRADLRAAAQESLRHGITSFQDAGVERAELSRVEDLISKEELGVRLWVMLDGSEDGFDELDLDAVRRVDPFGWLTVRAIKLYADGALGSRGAWLLAPYADQPDQTGLAIVRPERIREVGERAIAHGYQVAVHAIGDRANRETLDAYEAAFAAHPDRKDLRWRIEHAQHLDPADIPRFAGLGVTAAMQPIHCTSDAPWVVPRLGEERARTGAYVWRSLLDSGAVIASGTDAPVESVDPIANFHAAVTRQPAEGPAFFAGQRMTREEALVSMTRDAAWAAFEEEAKGTLEVGKLADVTVFSGDLLTVPDEAILDVRPVMTIVGGEVRWEATP